MPVDTFADIEKLVGTTWERDGLQREVTRVENGNVYWRRPGGKERKQPQWFPYFRMWLEKAVKVEG